MTSHKWEGGAIKRDRRVVGGKPYRLPSGTDKPGGGWARRLELGHVPSFSQDLQNHGPTAGTIVSINDTRLHLGGTRKTLWTVIMVTETPSAVMGDRLVTSWQDLQDLNVISERSSKKQEGMVGLGDRRLRARVLRRRKKGSENLFKKPSSKGMEIAPLTA